MLGDMIRYLIIFVLCLGTCNFQLASCGTILDGEKIEINKIGNREQFDDYRNLGRLARQAPGHMSSDEIQNEELGDDEPDLAPEPNEKPTKKPNSKPNEKPSNMVPGPSDIIPSPEKPPNMIPSPEKPPNMMPSPEKPPNMMPSPEKPPNMIPAMEIPTYKPNFHSDSESSEEGHSHQ